MSYSAKNYVRFIIFFENLTILNVMCEFCQKLIPLNKMQKETGFFVNKLTLVIMVTGVRVAGIGRGLGL